MKSTLSGKGQVTIPKAIRDTLGLRPGSVLEFEAVNGRLVGVKSEPADPFRGWLGRGRLPRGLDVDSYLDRIRG